MAIGRIKLAIDKRLLAGWVPVGLQMFAKLAIIK